MKFTSEDLMKAMGLQVGDKIKVKNSGTFTIKRNGIFIHAYANEDADYLLHQLVDHDYEILPKPKRVGDTLCKDYECVECHLRCLPHCNQLDSAKKTLFNILDGWNKYDTFDQEIYDLLKARLDKEVE